MKENEIKELTLEEVVSKIEQLLADTDKIRFELKLLKSMLSVPKKREKPRPKIDYREQIGQSLQKHADKFKKSNQS
jgi:hypothetical protein